MAMIVVSVVYPATPERRFDFGYYTATHIPLVRRRWGGMGLASVRLLRGVPAADGAAAPFVLVALLEFESVAAFQAAAAAHGKEILADVANFTDIKPLLQVNEQLG
jgi:uncharacterized protein (TIGR02118 family)